MSRTDEETTTRPSGRITSFPCATYKEKPRRCRRLYSIFTRVFLRPPFEKPQYRRPFSVSAIGWMLLPGRHRAFSKEGLNTLGETTSSTFSVVHGLLLYIYDTIYNTMKNVAVGRFRHEMHADLPAHLLFLLSRSHGARHDALPQFIA